jgi:hypothetical protein
MTDYPTSNTNRLLVDYRVGGVDRHTCMFRFQTGTSATEASAKISDVLEELNDAFYTDTIFESARWAQKGDDNSFPTPFTPVTGTASTSGRPADFRARFLSMVGRTVTGTNWHLSLFGVILIPDANFIILDSEFPVGSEMRFALVSAPNPICGVDENEIIPLTYFTSRVSAYWQRRIARNG